jgi:beta-mannosidase
MSRLETVVCLLAALVIALRKLPDPYVADNESKVQRVGSSDWLYQTHIVVDSAAT